MANVGGLRLLEGARHLVEHAWCRGADARDSNGVAVDPWEDEAVSWSLLGALVAVLERDATERGEMPLSELAAALYALAEVIDTDSLTAWNDRPRRTQTDVVYVLDRAAAGYEHAWAQTHGSPN
jgi:hypothetical protein